MPVMEWKSKTPSEWDWENLADFSGKEIEIPKQVQLSIHDTEGGIDGLGYSFGGTVFSGSAVGHGFPSKSSISDPVHSSSEEGIKTSRSVDALAEDFKEMEEVARVGYNGNIPTLGASVGSDEPMIGLKLGKRTYFEDMCASNITKTTSFSAIHGSSATTKRSKASYQSMQNPRCQVEGCKIELKSAKDYHRRHKICENHSKSPKVIVKGMERRFCQQCSRFHDLSEFDDKKRSCRRRLSDHNARRRRPQPEAMLFNSTRLSSSLFGGEQQINCLSNGVPVQVLNPVWQSACSFKFTQARDPLVGPAKAWGVGKRPELFSDEMSNGISSQYPHSDRILPLQETIPLVLNHGSEGSTIASNLDVAPDLCRALSLLSSNSWGLNEPERTSLEQLMHANQTNVAQPMMHAEPQNGSLASSEYLQVKQRTSDSQDHLFDLHNNSGGGSQFQEFQLFKAPYESSRFYSRHIN